MTDYQDLLRRLRTDFMPGLLDTAAEAASVIEALLKEREIRRLNDWALPHD